MYLQFRNRIDIHTICKIRYATQCTLIIHLSRRSIKRGHFCSSFRGHFLLSWTSIRKQLSLFQSRNLSFIMSINETNNDSAYNEYLYELYLKNRSIGQPWYSICVVLYSILVIIAALGKLMYLMKILPCVIMNQCCQI